MTKLSGAYFTALQDIAAYSGQIKYKPRFRVRGARAIARNTHAAAVRVGRYTLRTR